MAETYTEQAHMPADLAVGQGAHAYQMRDLVRAMNNLGYVDPGVCFACFVPTVGYGTALTKSFSGAMDAEERMVQQLPVIISPGAKDFKAALGWRAVLSSGTGGITIAEVSLYLSQFPYIQPDGAAFDSASVWGTEKFVLATPELGATADTLYQLSTDNLGHAVTTYATQNTTNYCWAQVVMKISLDSGATGAVTLYDLTTWNLPE